MKNTVYQQLETTIIIQACVLIVKQGNLNREINFLHSFALNQNKANHTIFQGRKYSSTFFSNLGFRCSCKKLKYEHGCIEFPILLRRHKINLFRIQMINGRQTGIKSIDRLLSRNFKRYYKTNNLIISDAFLKLSKPNSSFCFGVLSLKSQNIFFEITPRG